MQAITASERWDVLSQERKDQMLNKYADINVDYDWWDRTIDDFKNHTEEHYGIRVEDVTFSGFWTQGDGAAFQGYVWDWAKALRDVGMLLYYSDGLVSEWLFSSSCSRGNNMRFSCDLELPYNPYHEEEEVLQYLAFQMSTPDENWIDELEARLRDHFESLAADLYRSVKDDYEYLTSEESITEYILNNYEHELVETEEEETTN